MLSSPLILLSAVLRAAEIFLPQQTHMEDTSPGPGGPPKKKQNKKKKNCELRFENIPLLV
jgi:hypothetical protein